MKCNRKYYYSSSLEGTVFLYLTRQHYRETVPEGEDNNMLSTEHLILNIKDITHSNFNGILSCLLCFLSFCCTEVNMFVKLHHVDSS